MAVCRTKAGGWATLLNIRPLAPQWQNGDYHSKNLLSRDRNSREGWGAEAGAATYCFSTGILGKNINETINKFLLSQVIISFTYFFLLQFKTDVPLFILT